MSWEASKTNVLWSNLSNVTCHTFLGIHSPHLHSEASKKFCSKAFVSKTIQPCTPQTHVTVEPPLLTAFSLIRAAKWYTWGIQDLVPGFNGSEKQTETKINLHLEKCLFTNIWTGAKPWWPSFCRVLVNKAQVWLQVHALWGTSALYCESFQSLMYRGFHKYFLRISPSAKTLHSCSHWKISPALFHLCLCRHPVLPELPCPFPSVHSSCSWWWSYLLASRSRVWQL